jgi:hypothetical protein
VNGAAIALSVLPSFDFIAEAKCVSDTLSISVRRAKNFCSLSQVSPLAFIDHVAAEFSPTAND